MSQKATNKIGWFFTAIIITEIAFLFISALWFRNAGTDILLMFNYSGTVLIVCLFIFINRQERHLFRNAHPISIPGVGYTLVVTIASMPAAIFINLLSQEITVNKVTEVSDSLLAENKLLIIATVCIISPILEEIIFRGIIFNGLQEYSINVKAIVISALCFGLYHKNLNQFCYAFYMGIVFCLMDTACGSILSSVTSHIAINSANIALLYYIESLNPYETVNYESNLSIMIGVFFILTVISLPCVYLALRKLAESEGREFKLYEAISQGKNGTRVILNVPMITGILLCIVFIVLF